MSEEPVEKRYFKPSRLIVLGLVLLAIVIAVWLLKLKFLGGEIRNVILVSIDTCRADHLSCYGYSYKTTPSIDDLAKEGILFENAIAAAPITLPSHSSMLTGTNPPYHGVHGNYDYKLGSSNVTLAEVLHQHGFTTGAIVGAFVLDSQFGLAQGFDTYNDHFEKPFDTTGINERRAEEVSRFACEWLDKYKDKKFFLFLHYYDPHFAYVPPEPFASFFAGNPYAGEIAYTDYCIGQVIEELKKLGLYNSTLIIITADHGEMLGEHGENTHGYFIYKSTIKVPLIIRLPGRVLGRQVDTTVGSIDIVPTICSLLGIRPPSTMQGRDLSCFLNKKEEAKEQKRYYYCESLTPTEYGCTALLGIIDGHWKYIQAPRAELYDLSKDPNESHNLVNEDPKRAKFLQSQLKLILQEQLRTDQADNKMVLDDESRKRLESLGYVSTGGLVEDFEFESNKGDPKDSLRLSQLVVRLNRFIRIDNYTEAEILTDEILKERPEYILNYFYLGKVAFGKNRLNESLKYYSRFLTTLKDANDTNSPDKSYPFIDKFVHGAYHDMGMVFSELGDVNQAIIHYSKAIEADPCDYRTYYNLGNTFLEQKKLERACSYYEKALAIDPNFSEAHNNLGNALLGQGKIEQAVRHYTRAVELKPDWQDAQNNLRLAKKELFEKVISSWNESLLKDPNQPELHKKLGIIYNQQGDYEKAVSHWKSTVRLEPGNFEVLNNLAWLLAVHKNASFSNPQEAVDFAYRACELTDFQHPAYLDTLSVAYAAAGRFPEAMESAQKAINLAKAANQQEIAEEIKKHLELYKQGQAYFESER